MRIFIFIAAFLSLVYAQSSFPANQDPDPEKIEQRLSYAVMVSGGEYRLIPELNERVRSIGERLAAAADPERRYRFVVLNDHLPKLWTMPEGKIAISWGAVRVAENDAELAALLSHALHHAVLQYDEYLVDLVTAYKGTELVPFGKRKNYAIDGAQVPIHILLLNDHDRIDELQADFHGQRYMAIAGYNPAAMVTVQEKLIALSEEGESELLLRHPPTEERKARSNEQVARLGAQMPGQWSFGAGLSAINDELAEKTAAYELYSKAQDTYLWRAKRLVSKAISIAPGEGKFLASLGELERRRKNCKQAREAFAKADQLGFADYSMRLGQAYCELQENNSTDAEKYLKASIDFLPNAVAQRELAVLLEDQGSQAGAKKAWLKLIATGGSYQLEAEKRFVRLDLKDNAQLYFLAQSLVRDGEFFSVITNQSGYPVSGLEVRFTAKLAGEDMDMTVSAGELVAEGQVTLYPGWKINDGDEVENVYVRVVAIK